ncbi:hypothetical protein J1605_003636 [Eschrichtius robustus]|uniref:Uncharacterized protein n=1 Tax=Eschrichtius robustus TaxID=9764 RepID=A0AB34HN30_ESCRO|nr:hypothetical protein J1605_003636 [Eschrichtius robustus]
MALPSLTHQPAPGWLRTEADGHQLAEALPSLAVQRLVRGRCPVASLPRMRISAPRPTPSVSAGPPGSRFSRLSPFGPTTTQRASAFTSLSGPPEDDILQLPSFQPHTELAILHQLIRGAPVWPQALGQRIAPEPRQNCVRAGRPHNAHEQNRARGAGGTAERARRSQCAEQKPRRPHCARAGPPPRCRPMGSQHPPLTTRAPPLGETPRPGGWPPWKLGV